MKKIYRPLALFLALVLLLTTMLGCGGRRRPLNYLKSSVMRTLARSGVGDILSLLSAALTDGAVSLSFTGGADAPISAGSAQLYFDREDGHVMADTALTMAGESYDARLWLGEDELALSSTAFLGSTTLGVDLTTLEQDLINSIFRSNSGTAFADPRVNDHSDEAVLALVQGFFSLYRAGGEVRSLLDKRLDSFLKCLTDYASYSRYTERGRLYIHVKLDNSMLSRALRAAWGEAVQDKSFVARLRALAKTRDAMSSARAGVTVDGVTARVESWLASDAEIEALCARIDNEQPFAVELSATVRRLTARVSALAFTYTAGDTVRGASLDFEKKDEATLALTVDDTTHQLVFRTEKEGLRRYRAAFAYTRTGEAPQAVDGTLEVNRRQGTYTLLLAGTQTRTVTGKISLDRRGFSCCVEQMTVDDRPISFTLSLAVQPRKELPDMPLYVSLATVTEPRFTPVYHRAVEARTRFDEALDASGVKPDAKGLASYLLGLAEIE